MNIKHAVIVLPTYNENENIVRLLDVILKQEQRLINSKLSVLVVDDSSPDGTGKIVLDYSQKYPNVQLLNGTKKLGLGTAYIRGFKYAIDKLDADVVFEMDADFSHDPNDIPRLLNEAINGSDFVIGSRYISGGTIPRNWSGLRKANSKWGNFFARRIAGLGKVKDCTSGYRAIKTDLLKHIDLDKLGAKGYAFQINLLHRALSENAKVTELPIHFTDRAYGKSKLRLTDIIEFILNSLILGLYRLKIFIYFSLVFIFSLVFSLLIINAAHAGLISFHTVLPLFITCFSFILSLQGLFTLIWMLYAWENPDDAEDHKSPKSFYHPHHSFTALVPASHEERVITDTIRALNNIEYPSHLKEVLVICKVDDQGTIIKVQEAIKELGENNIRLILYDGPLKNKPHSLNYGLKEAKNELICIFDAEDEPHPDIYNIINTVVQRDQVDVVQSGVQLMNYRAHWFSAINVLEYFLWFKSGLLFFLKIGNVTPLGGNTVFCKKNWLEKLKGWDENCLTEDADIGIRLILAGAKTSIIYDEQHVTQEETPANAAGFIKQRTRWNQGFLQILAKGDWKKLPLIRQKLITLYVLLSPLNSVFLLLYTPLAIWVALTQKIPMIVSLFSFLPLYLLLLQLLVYIVSLYEFTRSYKLNFPFWMPFKILFTFYPYQILLFISSLRTLYRITFKRTCWEKTLHINGHRKMTEIPILAGILHTN